MPIDQAFYGNPDAGGYRFLATSPGFLDAWRADAERLCQGFGERPVGIACPFALFAKPFGYRHVAVVQVADQGKDDAGRPGAIAFRLLILPKRLYADLGGDLFLINEAFPPAWDIRGSLPTLEWMTGAPPPRTVGEVRTVLDVVADRSQTLLGGVQILVDGGRLVFVRTAPDPGIVQDLWKLLPDATRAELWPTTFAFGNKHGFHIAVVPSANGAEYEHYVKEADAGDYPEGRYEYALQKAAEDGDQGELDALLARRSRGQMLRLALVLLALFVLIPPLILSMPKADVEKDPPAKANTQPTKEETMDLPPASEFAPLTEAERIEMATRLQALATKLTIKLPEGHAEETLQQALIEFDQKIGKKTTRNPGPLEKLGPLPRQLRGLLWKHGGKEYNNPRLNFREVLEQLEKQLEGRTSP